MRNERLPAVTPGYIPVAPDIAVEIVSPTDRFTDVQQKIHEYLDAGTAAVWLVQPRARSVTVYRKDAAAIELHETDELVAEEVLPGFGMKVARFFVRPSI